MKYPEDLLPEAMQLNTTVTEYRDYLDQLLTSSLSARGDILSIERQIFSGSHKIRELSRVLAALLTKSFEDDAEVGNAMFRGMTFALQIAEVTSVTPVETVPTGTLFESEDGQDYATFLLRSVSQYLSARPAVDTLVSYYMPEIDPSHQANHYAEIGAGIMFMLTERQEGEFYLSTVMENVEPEQFFQS